MKKMMAFAGLCLVVLALAGCGAEPVKVTGAQDFDALAAMSGCTPPPEYSALSTVTPDTFAQCLTEAGMTFYGAYWCPHCQDQKAMFGESLQYVNYVECDAGGENAQPEACVAAGVEYYPTWILD